MTCIKSKLVIGLIIVSFSLNLNAQNKKPDQFASLSLHTGVIHSQLNIFDNGLQLGYGIISSEKSIVGIRGHFNYGSSPGQDHRDCHILNYGIGLNAMLPVYQLIVTRLKLQFYASAAIDYNLSSINSFVEKELESHQNLNYPVFRIGGAVQLPLSKSWYAKMPVLSKTNFFVALHQSAAVSNNVSSFYREYSNISSVTWGQELSILIHYSF